MIFQVVYEASFHEGEGGKTLIFHTLHDLNYNNLIETYEIHLVSKQAMHWC